MAKDDKAPNRVPLMVLLRLASSISSGSL